jgi:hypothetical protein
MTVLIADEVLLTRLRGVVEPIEIHDPSGKILGRYTPILTPEETARILRLKGLFDLEEAERILATQRDQGRPLADILQRLQSTGAQE